MCCRSFTMAGLFLYSLQSAQADYDPVAHCCHCRPLRLGAAFVLLTTTPDVRRPTRMHIKIQPQDDDEATLMLAANIRHLATADVPAPKVTVPNSQPVDDFACHAPTVAFQTCLSRSLSTQAWVFKFAGSQTQNRHCLYTFIGHSCTQQSRFARVLLQLLHMATPSFCPLFEKPRPLFLTGR